jgi:hypothetical protein
LEPLKRSELKRKTPLRSRPSDRKVKDILRARAAQPKDRPQGPEKGTMEWALDAPFRARGPARTQDCKRCRKRKAHHWHHWTPQTTLRTYMRSKSKGEDPFDIRKELGILLRDDRNLTPLCNSCHAANGIGWTTVPMKPPESAYEFATELGDEWLVRLERAYTA